MMTISKVKRWVLSISVVGALIVCVLMTVRASHRADDLATRLTVVSGRLAAIEQRVTARELADPWTPVDCSYEEGLGSSADHPCFTSFDTLRLAPHKFHSRWIAVRAYYVGGFETSALLGALPDPNRNIVAQRAPAVWIDAGFPDTWPPKKINVIGQFLNGPAGHMSAYFGRLTSARIVPSS